MTYNTDIRKMKLLTTLFLGSLIGGITPAIAVPVPAEVKMKGTFITGTCHLTNALTEINFSDIEIGNIDGLNYKKQNLVVNAKCDDSAFTGDLKLKITGNTEASPDVLKLNESKFNSYIGIKFLQQDGATGQNLGEDITLTQSSGYSKTFFVVPHKMQEPTGVSGDFTAAASLEVSVP